MTALVALVAGLLFGGGLLLSGMADPKNVIAFLDVGGHWSPSLAFTLAAAIGVAMPAFAYARRTGRSLRGAAVNLAVRARIDGPLIWGSSLFGIGWGLSGVCPGPGLILVATGAPHSIVFAIGYIVGVYAVDSLSIRRTTGGPCRAAQNASFF
jgi:uncharacterized membrane protein YedE/YeeE